MGTMQCSICKEVVPITDYGLHVQNHAKQASTQPVGASVPASGSGPMRMTGPINADKFQGLDYLKGTDIPMGTVEVKFKLLEFVVDKSMRSKLTAHISETFGKKFWGLNTTNIKILAGLGYPDLQAVCGKDIVCTVGYQPNPQQNNMPTPSLFVLRVE